MLGVLWAMPCRSRPANLLRDADIIIDRWSGQLYTTRNPNSDSHHHHRHHHYARQRIKSRKVKTGACRATCLYSLRLLPVAVPTRARLSNSNSITTSERTWQPVAGVSEWLKVASCNPDQTFPPHARCCWKREILKCWTALLLYNCIRPLTITLTLTKMIFRVCNNWIHFDGWS